MALLNLSDVTSSLITLLETNIGRLRGSPPAPAVVVLPAAPNAVPANSQNRLSLYLYHVAEDPYYRNAPGAGNDPPNVAKAPMGLCLYYILTAHHENNQPGDDALTQQELMGYALKTFHDNPIIPDTSGAQNSIQIIMRQLEPESATGFWTSEDQQMTRLSSYYEVRVVFLEPEEPQSSPGTVLQLGAYLVQTGAPVLSSTSNSIVFTLPASFGGATQTVRAQPARAILDNRPAGTPPEHHRRFTLLGSGLSAGIDRTLVFRHARWTHLNPDLSEVPVDLAQNPTWSISATPEGLDVEFQPTINYLDENGAAQSETIWPGLYTVELRAILSREILLGQPKEIIAASNQIPFTVAPRIASHTISAAPDLVTIQLGAEIDLTDLDQPHDHVQVSLDGVVYTETTSNPPTSAREWFREPNRILLSPHINLSPPAPEAHSFRLVINGAETAPYFFEVP